MESTLSEKKCGKCKSIKPLENFTKSICRKSGYESSCKTCVKMYRMQHKEDRKLYIEKNKEKFQQYNTEYGTKWRIDNNNKQKEYFKQYYQKNKEKINERMKDKRINNSQFQIANNLRSRLGKALNGICKSAKTLQLLGCTIHDLKYHLESKFTSGMNWYNYGRRCNTITWEIDHIIPCSYFDLTNPNEQKKCFHYSNLQPLWASDNVRKSNKLVEQHTSIAGTVP